MRKLLKKNLKAYSILEIVVTLAIVTIILVMLSDVLVLTMRVTRKSFARSVVREEQNNILTLMEKDLRNARYVGACAGVNENASCEVGVDQVYYWTTCQRENGDLYLCKLDSTKSEVVEAMPEDIVLNSISFEEAISDSPGRKSVLITLDVSHINPDVEVTNQVRQIVVSTRNYTLE